MKTDAMRGDSRVEQAGATRLPEVGLALALGTFVLIIPLGMYQMDFMLWPWIWPVILSFFSAVISGYSLLRGLAPQSRRLVPVIGLVVGVSALLISLAGFTVMLVDHFSGMTRMGM